MSEERMALVELLSESGDFDSPEICDRGCIADLREADVEGLIGADPAKLSSIAARPMAT